MARWNRVVRAVGAITRLFSWWFLAPAALAWIYDSHDTQFGPFLIPRAVLVFVGCFGIAQASAWALVRVAGDKGLGELRDRDALLTVGTGWLFLSSIAMLPFMMEGVLLHPMDAFFEAMSGLTTTGSTVLTGDYEAVPKSLMIWRALLQFIGGMGIIVLSVALLSRMSQGGGIQLLQAEAPGPSIERITPRVAETARLLWSVYVGMAGVLFFIVLVVLSGHELGLKTSVYEAIILTLTTISTGGFGAHADSIAYFDDVALELVLVLFMLLSGMNYTLHYRALRGDAGRLFKDPEWRYYMGTFVIVTLAVTGALYRTGESVATALRGSVFTVASLITSTGFSTADFGEWPVGAHFLLVIIMFIGATAGSTGGGIKHVRVLLLLRHVRSQVRKSIHPRAVLPVRLGVRSIRDSTVLTTGSFVAAFIAIWLLGTILLSFDPALPRFEDATSASVSALSNMGPGLGSVGPSHTYAALTDFSKGTLAMEMWFGRLEVFAALLVFLPESWRY